MITFSFREKKKEEQEKYDFPVLTQLPYTGEKNTIAKFTMNKAALEAFGYPKDLKGYKISVAREQESKDIVLVDTTNQETVNQYNINKDGSFNSQFLLKKLMKQKHIDPKEQHEFWLQFNQDEYSGLCYVTIEDMPSNEPVTEGNVYPAYTHDFQDVEEDFPEGLYVEDTEVTKSEELI